MNSFNDLNGVPASGSAFLMRNILKGEWNFNGFVVSDWASIREMIPHGFAENDRDAAKLALNAGSDMDMEGYCYRDNLKDLVEKGEVSLSNLDDAVRRVLRKKFEMGLFEDPFRFTDPVREEKAMNNPEHRKAARDMARKSIVLLKNDDELLPLKNGQKIALIGPLAKSEDDMLGGWAVGWDDNSDVVSQFEGFEIRFGKQNLLYSKGCGVSDPSKDGFEDAIKTAKAADVVVLSIGESRSMNGEAASRSNLGLPGVQEDLVKEIMATGKPVVILINAGRPLVFNWVADNVPTIVYTWWLGSEAGNAIADVLSGDYNPSGKLTVSFPRNEGQIPIYYNHFNTGRPSMQDIPSKDYRTGYIDLKQSSKFPFGYGLSYTSFDYSNLVFSSDRLSKDGVIDVTLTVKNSGDFDGEEVVQLYIRDLVASLVRPVKELKDFKKISLKSGESKKVTFKVDKEKLSFYNEKLDWVAEEGKFDIMIGSSSADIRLKGTIVYE